jgi:hypothetical protein
MRPPVPALPGALAAALIAALAAPASAQGSDACNTPQPIAGTGTFPFDNSTATTDGVPNPLCLAFGTSDISNDVWFEWTPPAGGVYVLETCGQTSIDSRIAVLDAPCTGTTLACNDDTCGLQSRISWNASAGSTYHIRIGCFPGANGGTGTFSVSALVPQQNPVNGHHYLALRQDGIGWDPAQAAAQAWIFQGVAGHLATLTDQSENDFVFALGDVHYHWLGGYQDTLDPGYSEPAGAWKWVTGEAWAYTNWWSGGPEPNNMGSFGDENYLEILQGGGFGASWNDAHPMEHPRGFVIEWDTGSSTPYCFGDGSGGVCPCGNTGGAGEGCANSTGAGATADSGGSPSVSADDLTFSGDNLLASQPALLFSGENSINGGNGIAFGDGLRCAGTNVVRLGVQIPDGAGAASWGPGLGAMGGWIAGDIRRFQVWYRDPVGSPCGAGFNLTNGLEVAFVP